MVREGALGGPFIFAANKKQDLRRKEGARCAETVPPGCFAGVFALSQGMRTVLIEPKGFSRQHNLFSLYKEGLKRKNAFVGGG